MTRVHTQNLGYLKCVLTRVCDGSSYVPNLLTHICISSSTLPSYIDKRSARSENNLAAARMPQRIFSCTYQLGVGFVPYYMHRRKDIYGEDAMEFRPERWEASELASIGWAYLPFHGVSGSVLVVSTFLNARFEETVALTFSKGSCLDGSLLCYYTHSSRVSKYQSITGASSCPDRSGMARVNYLSEERRRLQGASRVV